MKKWRRTVKGYELKLGPEAKFMLEVKQEAQMNGWMYFHPYDSRKSVPGYPDCTMVRNGRLIFAELKAHEGSKGKPTIFQQQWLEELATVRTVEVYLWNPNDMETIKQVLR
tara:strand:+ start:2635 stop:2967 length:333 start_codon:yes stop_codon:yes gene_type:complete